ncbi:MAG TPA: efflux RND transporter periplasmic adaptor subunit [Sulfuricurvum sp.]|nr:efflux RND transporter periplasmic adaptor subunit [Sulfuricurvum sp.]
MIKIFITLLSLIYTINAADIYATFDVVPQKEASLTLMSSGIVKTLKADVGSRVKKGDLLLEIDNDDLIASIALAKESVKKAQIEEQFARQTYERYKKVESVIDAELMDQHTLIYQKASASAAEAKASLRYKETLVEKTRLRAPFSGVISERNVQLGDGVGGGAIPLFRLISSPNAKLVVKFDEKYLPYVRKGSHLRYRVDGENRYRNGSITKVYPSIDPKTRKATAEVSVSGISPGLFGEAYITGNGK